MQKHSDNMKQGLYFHLYIEIAEGQYTWYVNHISVNMDSVWLSVGGEGSRRMVDGWLVDLNMVQLVQVFREKYDNM